MINAFIHGEENTEVTLCVSASDGTLKIDLSDNGKGMEPETARHLFDRYYLGANTEQRPEGSGLGLAIAKSIIELHGGKISVSSTPIVGTAFQFGVKVRTCIHNRGCRMGEGFCCSARQKIAGILADFKIF